MNSNFDIMVLVGSIAFSGALILWMGYYVCSGCQQPPPPPTPVDPELEIAAQFAGMRGTPIVPDPNSELIEMAERPINDCVNPLQLPDHDYEGEGPAY